MRKTERHIKKKNRFPIILPILTIIGIGIFAVLTSFYEKTWSYNWNGINEQIRDSVKVAENNGISSGWVGIAPRRPKQYDRRFWIMNNATESELIKLTDYPNGTIKTIAYEGLLRKPEFENKVDLMLKAIKDTEYSIFYRTGCEGMNMNISEYLVDLVLLIDDKGLLGKTNRYNLPQNDIDVILNEYKKVPSLWK
ncbi:MAG: hypothetical protein CMC05_04035 [Flavobacteriaceae bacterium]|nr:hypothetical protein [Flavobacteriaceae bacterium]MBD11062.1 hypothetical protein [Flavobacteriaceae bacterium]|tara:strand:- start:1454 stop:2038 length:585 start_codon:yes stop_codon:yes gene_type:complete